MQQIEGPVVHVQKIPDVIEAWRSHATLQRQAGAKFHDVISRISSYLGTLGGDSITVPYTTRIWLAQRLD